MSNLLEWKEKLQTLYAQYSTYIDKGIRFLLALISFLLINSQIGFMQKLTNPLISVGLALVCAFVPQVITVFAAAALLLVHLYSLSVGVAAIAAVILLLMFIFYFRFTPKKALILLLTPIAFACRVPMLIPIAYGLSGTPVFAIPIVCGTIVYFLANYAKTFSTTLNSAEKAAVMDIVTRFAKQFFQSREMWVAVAAMALCLLLVYALRRKSMDHSWEIAIASGAGLYIVIMLLGDLMLDANVKYIPLIIGTLVSAALGFGLELMIFSVDYARAEYLQFEDDEYYYYVKAIPKVSVAAPEKKVKRINKRQETQSMPLPDDGIDIDKIIEQELLK